MANRVGLNTLMKVKQLIEEKGLSVENACEKVGVSSGTWRARRDELNGKPVKKQKEVEHTVMHVHPQAGDRERIIAMTEDVISILKRLA